MDYFFGRMAAAAPAAIYRNSGGHHHQQANCISVQLNSNNDDKVNHFLYKLWFNPQIQKCESIHRAEKLHY